jgi:glycosyltransferase involved in cell wall biosynthesis
MTIGDLGDWVRSGKVISHLFRHKEVAYYVSHYQQVIRPFLCFLFLKLICRGNCYVQDAEGCRHSITLLSLIKHFFKFIKEGIQVPFYLLLHTKTIKTLSNQPKLNKPTLNLSYHPLYLRTDRAIGLIAGGEMGHTIGVINSLDQFTAKPILMTTIKIPNLDPEINYHVIKLEQQFKNFDNVLLLASTDLVFKETLSKFSNTSFSFVYQRYSTYNYSGALIAKKLNIPLIIEYNYPANWTSTNWEKGLKYKCLAENIELLNVNRADVVVVVSKPLRNILVSKGVNSEKILVNPNGVDPDIYSPSSDNSKIRKKLNLQNKTVIGFIGTFGRWHGAEVLAKAYGLLLETYPDYRKTTQLLMIGDGVTLPQVKNEIEHFNSTENVTLTGIIPQEEGPEYLSACDILASPHIPNSDGTPFFGSPTKLFEYMAMGKGIVASDLDQIGEVLQHNHTAWLTQPGNAESLMNGIKVLLDDPSKAQRLGQAARHEVIDKYTWKEHTRKIIEKLKERCSGN